MATENYLKDSWAHFVGEEFILHKGRPAGTLMTINTLPVVRLFQSFLHQLTLR